MFKKVVWANDGSIVMERLLPVVKQVTEANDGARVVVAHVQEHLTIGRRASARTRAASSAKLNGLTR